MHSGGQYLGPLLDIFMDIQKEHIDNIKYQQ